MLCNTAVQWKMTHSFWLLLRSFRFRLVLCERIATFVLAPTQPLGRLLARFGLADCVRQLSICSFEDIRSAVTTHHLSKQV